MIEVHQTETFATWLRRQDGPVIDRVLVRVRRLELGNFGDAKFFDGIGELRITYGPGYRVYFVRRGSDLVILLGGGSKKTQSKDIVAAKALAKEV